MDGAKIVVTNSMVKHSLVTSAYNDRRNESAQALKDLQTVCDIKTLGDLTDEEFEAHKDAIKDEVARKRGKHAVYENQRTIKAVKALKIMRHHVLRLTYLLMRHGRFRVLSDHESQAAALEAAQSA